MPPLLRSISHLPKLEVIGGAMTFNRRKVVVCHCKWVQIMSSMFGLGGSGWSIVFSLNLLVKIEDCAKCTGNVVEFDIRSWWSYVWPLCGHGMMKSFWALHSPVWTGQKALQLALYIRTLCILYLCSGKADELTTGGVPLIDSAYEQT